MLYYKTRPLFSIVFFELFPRGRQRGQWARCSLLPRQPFATESARFLWGPAAAISDGDRSREVAGFSSMAAAAPLTISHE